MQLYIEYCIHCILLYIQEYMNSSEIRNEFMQGWKRTLTNLNERF